MGELQSPRLAVGVDPATDIYLEVVAARVVCVSVERRGRDAFVIRTWIGLSFLH